MLLYYRKLCIFITNQILELITITYDNGDLDKAYSCIIYIKKKYKAADSIVNSEPTKIIGVPNWMSQN